MLLVALLQSPQQVRMHTGNGHPPICRLKYLVRDLLLADSGSSALVPDMGSIKGKEGLNPKEHCR